MHGTFLKHLPAQASNDGITFHNASHPTHGVSLRSLRPRRQTPAPAPLTVSWRICLDWMPAVVLPGIPLDLHHFRRRRASRRRSKSKVVETSAPNSSASGHHCSRSHLSSLESVPSFFEEFLCTLRISLGIQIQACNGTKNKGEKELLFPAKTTQLAMLDPAASSAHPSVTLHALMSIARFVSAPPRSSLWRRFAPALTLFVLR